MGFKLHMNRKNKEENTIVFGETLYDQFPEGQVVLGGAPFNVSWHLKSFGTNPLLISSVGSDHLGHDVIKTMKQKGLSTDGVRIHNKYPTGLVDISFKDQEPQYSIMPDQAYDHIDSLHNISGTSILYHGSLALRGEKSQKTLFKIRESVESVFVDINIRLPWFSLDIANKIVKNIDWLKINSDEFDILMGIEIKDDEERIKTSRILMDKANIKNMIITLGSRGSWYISKEKAFHTAPFKTDTFVDSVGAGDCFSAVALLGIELNWTVEAIMKRASKAASLICTKRGAIVKDSKFYKDLMGEWN